MDKMLGLNGVRCIDIRQIVNLQFFSPSFPVSWPTIAYSIPQHHGARDTETKMDMRIVY